MAIMIGKHRFTIYDSIIKYDLTVQRNMTFIRGNSGSGKSNLISMIEDYLTGTDISGISVETDCKFDVLNRGTWSNREQYNNYLLFVDEENVFLKTDDFSNFVKNSSNYFVVVFRYPYRKYANLPYSYTEIYNMVYYEGRNTLSPVYHKYDKFYAPDLLIVEDSKSGYQFFCEVAKHFNIECLTAKGNSNILRVLKKMRNELDKKKILIIADGAAFGPHIDELLILAKEYPNIQLWLPESFEYLLLNSNMFD